MKIKKNFTLGPLPPFKWDRTGTNWNGKVVRKENQGELPIPFFEEQFDYGFPYSINYMSPTYGAQNCLIRQPCVIIGGDSDLISSLSGSLRERFDRLSVIHVSGFPVPNYGPVNALQNSSVMQGQPTYQDDDDVWRLRPKEEWAAGRTYVIAGPHADFDNYFDYDYSNYGETEVSWPLCGDGEQDCDQHADDPGCAGVYEPETIQHDATDVDITPDPTATKTLEQDLADLEEIIEQNYDKFRLCAWFEEEPVEITTRRQCACIILDESCYQVLLDAEPEAEEGTYVIGTDAAKVEKWRGKFNEVYGGIPTPNRFIRDNGPISNSEIINDILALFEAP